MQTAGKPWLALLAFGLSCVAFFGTVHWALAPARNWEHRVLPKALSFSQVVFSALEPGLLEGCEFALYSLDADVISGIQARGTAFFGGKARPANENRSNRYSAWQSTPAPEVFADGALSGCGRGPWANGLLESLQTPGSYYTITANREGMILVDPKQGVAAYMYFG